MVSKWNKFKKDTKKLWQGTKKVAKGSYETAQKASEAMSPGVKNSNEITKQVWGLGIPQQQQPTFDRPPQQGFNRPTNRNEVREIVREELRRQRPQKAQQPQIFPRYSSPIQETTEAPWDPGFFDPRRNVYKQKVGVSKDLDFYGGFFAKKKKKKR